MPEGKSIVFGKGEYPELEGLGDGVSVKFRGSATVLEDNNQVSLTISNIQFQTKNRADKSMEKLSQNSVSPGNKSRANTEDF